MVAWTFKPGVLNVVGSVFCLEVLTTEDSSLAHPLQTEEQLISQLIYVPDLLRAVEEPSSSLGQIPTRQFGSSREPQ